MQKSIDDIFIQKIKDKKIKVVSFDIFETLAFRDVADPKEIFKKVGKKKYVKKIFGDANIFRLARVEAEKTARKKYSRFEEVTLQQIYEQLPLQSEQREKILDLEIEQEYKSLYINPQIKRWIDLAIQHKKQIIFISDMYLSTQQIEHLVMSKLDSYKDTSKIFVSNEHQATKATGKLFQLVLESLKISNDEILHIGDNFHMDIEMAKSKNITALFYNNDKYVNEILEVESHYAGQFFNKGFHQRKLACIQNNYAKEKERFFFNLGASVFGPILWEFSHWLIDIAKQQKITQINCVMREGRIFKKFLEKLDNDLDINLVYASRKSTFLPSIDIANNSFDFHHYRKLTIKDFYELFRLKITDTFIDSHKTILFSEASEYILNKKMLPINPFRVFDYFLSDRVDRDLIRQGNNHLIKMCDELWVFGPISDGVLFEIFLSLDLGKPIKFFKIGAKVDEIKLIKRITDIAFEPEIHLVGNKKIDLLRRIEGLFINGDSMREQLTLL